MVLTFRLPSNLFAARGEGGPQTNWKASGRFLFIWLRRRRRLRDAVQIVVFVGGPLLETIVLLGRFKSDQEPKNRPGAVNVQKTLFKHRDGVSSKIT